MLGNKPSNKSIEQEGYDWYSDRIEAIQVERNRYFVLLIVAIIALIISLIANAMLSPLKTAVPYVLEVDKTTGITSVLKPGNNQNLQQDQAVTIYFLYKYLNARMSYNFDLRQTNADIVRALSSADSYRQYANMMDVNNPDSPIKKYANNNIVNVQIISHSFPYSNIAEIHFSTALNNVNAAPGNTPSKQYWVATIKYTFANNALPLSDRENINPLGFFVTNFQINQEIPGGVTP